MNWNQKIFSYCERGADPSFWAEPLNAITNVAFLIAAAAALIAWMRLPRGQRGMMELLLIAVVTVIGIGSFLFHTVATRWAALADTLPIGVFMLLYLAYALRRFLSLSWLLTGVLLAVFIASLQMAGAVRCGGGSCLNGSLGYVPAFLALALVGLGLMLRSHPAGGSLLAGAGVFALSLTLRTLDRSACPLTAITASAPIGTHFLWHVLNATLLYLLLRAAIRHGQRPLAAPAPSTA